MEVFTSGDILLGESLAKDEEVAVELLPERKINNGDP